MQVHDILIVCIFCGEKVELMLVFYKIKDCTFSDIEIALSQMPKDISLLASEVGLIPSEVDLYGKKKAKVSLSVLERFQDVQNGKYVVVTG